MCEGSRLVADFVAGTSSCPVLPEELGEHLTLTTGGLWVVWAHKLARQADGLFIPLTGGSGYPADARAECRRRRGVRGSHDAPDPGCTCGFHALSSQGLPGLPPRARYRFTALTVALSGRVLAFEWAGGGVLWRAERQTVVRVGPPSLTDRVEADLGHHLPHPGDPDGTLAAVLPAAPRDSGPVRLSLPASCPVVPMHHDEAGWCTVTSMSGATTSERPPASLVLA